MHVSELAGHLWPVCRQHDEDGGFGVGERNNGFGWEDASALHTIVPASRCATCLGQAQARQDIRAICSASGLWFALGQAIWYISIAATIKTLRKTTGGRIHAVSLACSVWLLTEGIRAQNG